MMTGKDITGSLLSGFSRLRQAMPAAAAILVAAFAFLGTSCKRRPLSEVDNNVIVNIRIDKDIVNYVYSRDPEMMRVMFFNSGDGTFSTQAFLPASGGSVSVTPGRTYDILTYNFDTQSAVVTDEYLWNGICATTNTVSEEARSRLRSRATKFDDEMIVYEPDHLFAGRTEDFYIPARSVDAPPVVIDLYAETVVETWKVYIDKIRGMEYVSRVAGVISGLALSNTLADDEESADEASVFFESMHYDIGGKVDITFNTFGRNPDFHGEQILSLVVTDIGGDAHIFNFDVSSQFIDNPEQVIYINTDQIVIDKPDSSDESNGGLAPDVDEWEDIEIDIII